jgi:hypothetical protein
MRRRICERWHTRSAQGPVALMTRCLDALFPFRYLILQQHTRNPTMNVHGEDLGMIPGHGTSLHGLTSHSATRRSGNSHCASQLKPTNAGRSREGA